MPSLSRVLSCLRSILKICNCALFYCRINGKVIQYMVFQIFDVIELLSFYEYDFKNYRDRDDFSVIDFLFVSNL